MSSVTRILTAIDQGDTKASEELLPLVYEALRRLATQKLARENSGQTLQATALVHEAYIRLVGSADQQWDSSGHFFAAAAEAMRRILVENARRKRGLKRGGSFERRELDESNIVAPEIADDLLAVDEALDKLARTDPAAANLVKLRFFAGFTVREAAGILGVSPRTANHMWAYARAWLLEEIQAE